MQPLTQWPTSPPKDTPGSVQAAGSRGLLLSADVANGTRILLPLRWVDSLQGWRSHPAGPVTFDSAAAAGDPTDPKRYERYQGDSGDGWWHVLDLGGTGTLSDAFLTPVTFY